MSEYKLDERLLCDVEMILNGSFKPLKGFMNRKDYNSVVDTMHLSTGELWPLPIVLPIPITMRLEVGETLLLRDTDYSPIAKLLVEDIYSPDLEYECFKVLRTNDDNHPYVQYIKSWGDIVYVGGELELVRLPKVYNFEDIRLTPTEVKHFIKTHGWEKIVGFQTRNPMHTAHYELTQYALKQAGEGSKLLIQPIVGYTQADDIDSITRIKCYKHILKYYKKDQVKLCLIRLSMRMAGPREAMLHALIRKNYGCTHFIVGRDHAGPSIKTKRGESFYEPYDAHVLLHKFRYELGIKILQAKMFCFVKNKNIFLPMDEIKGDDEIEHISGTELRRRIKHHEDIPSWFTFEEVKKELIHSSMKGNGLCIYIIGLSSSGKTTLAKALEEKLLQLTPSSVVTLLDGDVVRTHLSRGLGFSKEDRSTNVRRIGYVAKEIVRHGGIVLCANIAPYQEDRDFNREQISKYGRYVEIFMNTSLKECERRDVKGLYKLARKGTIKHFTGIDDPFETPNHPDIIFTEEHSIEYCLKVLIDDILFNHVDYVNF